jgi:hypothetical protein
MSRRDPKFAKFQGRITARLKRLATPKGTLLALLAAVLCSGVPYFLGGIILTRTQSYQVASQCVRENTELVTEVGNIESVRLRPLWGFIEYNGEWGRAHYNITAVGSRKCAAIEFDLIYGHGAWTVERMTYTSTTK